MEHSSRKRTRRQAKSRLEAKSSSLGRLDENGGRKKKDGEYVEGSRLAVCRGYRMAYGLREVKTTEEALAFLGEEAQAWEEAQEDEKETAKLHEMIGVKEMEK